MLILSEEYFKLTKELTGLQTKYSKEPTNKLKTEITAKELSIREQLKKDNPDL